jgi:hypothetical protein
MQRAFTATTAAAESVHRCFVLRRQRQTDGKLGIEDANQRFYDAFRSGSLQVCSKQQHCWYATHALVDL